MDIRKIINDLVESGLSETEIGVAIGRSQATVNRLRNGRHETTDFNAGQKLQKLHADRLGNSSRAA